MSQPRPCKKCGAMIRFAKTANGKPMPLDAEPRRMWLMQGETVEPVMVYETHFATCPNAQEFRK